MKNKFLFYKIHVGSIFLNRIMSPLWHLQQLIGTRRQGAIKNLVEARVRVCILFTNTNQKFRK